MKVVIFAGGIGSRITEESHLKPKPMIEIGGKPILWHILKIYSSFGFSDFIICLGYKGDIIKEYFLNYYLHNSDLSINLRSNKVDVNFSHAETMNVTLVDTGLNTKTAGRLRRIKDYIGDDNDFMLTYGDGVSDINLHHLLKFHQDHGKIATLTAIQPQQQFGRINFTADGQITEFKEKANKEPIWINGGFFVLNRKVFDYLPENSDDMMWEDSPLENLTADGMLFAYKHTGFWKCMDAMRDKIVLDGLWDTNNAKWKIW